MRVIVISPESADPRELPALEGLFAAGLEHYHVRKPSWDLSDLEWWLTDLPLTWRARLILHEHHELVVKLGLGGAHEKDRSGYSLPRAAGRSCHDLPTLRASLGAYQTVLFGPTFPSLSKVGYGPTADFPWDQLKALLRERPSEGAAQVLAIGGITSSRLARCRDLGFDGAAVLGAVWSAPDPVRAYLQLRDAAAHLETNRHAA